MAKETAKKARTKSEVFKHLAEATGLTRKQVSAVFESLEDLIRRDLSSRGPGVFTVPGLMKISVRKVPARKAREGINPFTGEKIMIKARPATRKVKVSPLKRLKEMVAK